MARRRLMTILASTLAAGMLALPAAATPGDGLLSGTQDLSTTVETTTQQATTTVTDTVEATDVTTETLTSETPADGPTAPDVDLTPITEPVEDALAPVVGPAEDALAPVTDPVEEALTPVTEPAEEALAPVTEPVEQILSPASDPQGSGESGSDTSGGDTHAAGTTTSFSYPSLNGPRMTVDTRSPDAVREQPAQPHAYGPVVTRGGTYRTGTTSTVSDSAPEVAAPLDTQTPGQAVLAADPTPMPAPAGNDWVIKLLAAALVAGTATLWQRAQGRGATA